MMAAFTLYYYPLRKVLFMKFEYIFKYYNKNQFGLAIKTDDFELFTKLQAVINNAVIANEKSDSVENITSKKSKNSTKE